MKKVETIAIIILAVAIVLITYVSFHRGLLLGRKSSQAIPPIQTQPPFSDEGVACTMDAKMCPDGSYVGRVAPLCEFAPCP